MNPSHDCCALLMAELLAQSAAAQAAADPLRPVRASLLAGRSLHQGMLTATLGLSEQAFQTLWHDYFSGERLNLQNGPGEDIAELEDLGLANRNELSLLMTTAFHAQAALNVGDMKRKKFISHFYCKRDGAISAQRPRAEIAPSTPTPLKVLHTGPF